MSGCHPLWWEGMVVRAFGITPQWWQAEVFHIWVDQEDKYEWSFFPFHFHSDLDPSLWDSATHIQEWIFSLFNIPWKLTLRHAQWYVSWVVSNLHVHPGQSLSYFFHNKPFSVLHYYCNLGLKMGLQPSTCGCQGIGNGLLFSCKQHAALRPPLLWIVDTNIQCPWACSLRTELQAMGYGLDRCSTLLLELNSWPLSNTFSRVAYTLPQSEWLKHPVSRGCTPRSEPGVLLKRWEKICCRPLSLALVVAGSLWHSMPYGNIVPIFTWHHPHV